MATIEQAGTTAMPPYFGTVLRNGSSGPDSAQVQTWLNGVHTRWPQVPSVTVDGQYGSNTANAVKAFQTVAGLSADGQVGPSTWNALYAAFADIRGAGEVFCGITARSGDRRQHWGQGALSLGPRLATGVVAEQVQARDATALQRCDGSAGFPVGI